MSTILNVDDTEAQRYATSRMLRHAGFEVVEAATGMQALEMVRNRPDLVILDVNLPDISGFEVCRRIKSDETSGRVPVLHLSATMVSTQAKVAGLDGGADAYLTQPVQAEELLATVRALLRVRKAEETLWQSEEQYRLFFEANPLPCCILDSEQESILAVNDAAVQLYGYSRQEFMNLTKKDIRVEQDSGAGATATNHHGAVRRKHRTKSGKMLDVEVLRAPLRIAGKNAQLAIMQNITEKLEREQAQRDEEIQRMLLDRALQAQEDERRRIARELHDGAGQLMTSLLVGLRTIDDARQLKQVKQQARKLRKITSETLIELSRMARGLHSGVLENLGLDEALRRLVDDFASAQKMAVNLEFGNPPLVMERGRVQLGIYRIVQEALTNVARHSRATQVHIHFDWEQPDLRLTIEDDGKGFELADVRKRPSAHLGIAGMWQRAAILGGRLEVDSHPRRGTKIAVSIPLASFRSEGNVA